MKLAKLFLASPKLFWQLLLTAYQLKYLNRETQMSTQEDNLELTLFRFMSKITRKAAAMLEMFVLGILFLCKSNSRDPTGAGIRKLLLREELAFLYTEEGQEWGGTDGHWRSVCVSKNCVLKAWGQEISWEAKTCNHSL